MGLFGSFKLDRYKLRPGDPETWQMGQDGLVQGDTAVTRERQPGYFAGGDGFSGRDALAGILAAVGDAFTQRGGGQPMAMQGLMGNRLSAVKMAQDAQQMQAQFQQAFDALTGAGYDPAQAKAMAMGVLKPSDVKPDRMMTKSGDIVAFGNDGQPQTAYRETAPDLLPVQGAGVFAMDRHTGQPFGGSGPTVGTIEDGHRFKGGNPGDPNSWEPVGVGGGTGNGAGSFRTAPRFRR